MNHSLFRSVGLGGVFLVSLHHVFDELLLLGQLFASVLGLVLGHGAKLADDGQPFLQRLVGRGERRGAGHDHVPRREDGQVHA